jgi:hypothetical protein
MCDGEGVVRSDFDLEEEGDLGWVVSFEEEDEEED